MGMAHYSLVTAGFGFSVRHSRNFPLMYGSLNSSCAFLIGRFQDSFDGAGVPNVPTCECCYVKGRHGNVISTGKLMRLNFCNLREQHYGSLV